MTMTKLQVRLCNCLTYMHMLCTLISCIRLVIALTVFCLCGVNIDTKDDSVVNDETGEVDMLAVTSGVISFYIRSYIYFIGFVLLAVATVTIFNDYTYCKLSERTLLSAPSPSRTA